MYWCVSACPCDPYIALSPLLLVLVPLLVVKARTWERRGEEGLTLEREVHGHSCQQARPLHVFLRSALDNSVWHMRPPTIREGTETIAERRGGHDCRGWERERGRKGSESKGWIRGR